MKGFSLIEVVVALGILTALSFAGFTGLARYKGGRDVELTLKEMVAVIRDAQRSAITEKDGKTWGVSFINSTNTTHSYEVWSGSSYASGTVERAYPLGRNVFFGNPAAGFKIDSLFSALAGRPNKTRVISLANRKKDGLVGDVIILLRGTITTRIEKGLSGYWHFDEGIGATSYDASGFDNNGLFAGSFTWQAGSSCKTASCLSFNGTNNYISVPTSGSLNFGTGDFSVEAWGRTTMTTGGRYVYKFDSGPGTGFGLLLNAAPYSGKAQFRFWPAGQAVAISTTSVNDGEWHQVVGVRSGTTAQIYIDGKLEGSSVGATSNVTGGTNLYIGSDSVPSVFFNGLMDEVRIYNRALSAAEILDHYNDLK